MATNTYVALASVTASGSSSTQLVMTSIPGTYTDLILVGRISTSMVGVNGYLQFNGDTGSNYSWTRILGDGSSASSSRGTSQTGINYLVNDYTTTICRIQNYSNSTTFKTALVRANNPSDYVTATVGLWRNTAAITSVTIDLDGNTIPSGTTFSLYGIAAATANLPDTARATGGTVTYTNTDVIHTFTSSGTFTPSQSLTVDYLVVAGGGGGGTDNAGGGGAGGLRSTIFPTGGSGTIDAPVALTATNYTVTVGAGGAYGPTENRGSNGNNSVFGAITATGGGGAGSGSSTGSHNSGNNGGSGGGARGNRTGAVGGAGTANQGFSAATPPSGFASTGGGGAGASSAISTGGTTGTAGGAGVTLSISGSSVTYAGGGGASWNGNSSAGGSGGGGAGATSSGNGTAGTANRGGGGGGGGDSGGLGAAGGSGIVIIRYPKA
jgi:hypothetical protein